MNTFIAGAIQQFWLWVSFFSFAFKRPKGVSLLSAINPFGSTLYKDSMHKVCGHLGLDYSPSKERGYRTTSIELPDGNELYFYWEDRAEVGKTIESIYKDKVYGEPVVGVTIDVGAHIGIYSLFASNISKVFSIEPDRENHHILCTNTNKNIFPFNLALGEEKRVDHLYSDYLSTRRLLDGEGDDYQIVNVTTLEKFCKENFLDIVDMVKMDVEGYELPILRGGRLMLLKGSIKNLAIASYHYPEQEKEVREYLEQFGYETETIKAGGEIIIRARLPI